MFNPIELKKQMVAGRLQDSFEKARSGVYADNALNRKLMRVGQKYGETTNTFRPGEKVTATLPNGRTFSGKYVEPYVGGHRHMVRAEDGKTYGIKTEDLVKVPGQRRAPYRLERLLDLEYDARQSREDYEDLSNQRKQLQIDMEEELSALGDEAINNGNHPVVVRYSKQLDRLDNKIKQAKAKYEKRRDRLYEYKSAHNR